MCLHLDCRIDEKELNKKRVHSNGMIKVWKVIGAWKLRSGKVLTSIHRSSYYWKSGWNKSDRWEKELTPDEKSYREVHYGIHVYLTRKDAREQTHSSLTVVPVYVYKKDLPDEVIIPVYAYKKDLIAIGMVANGLGKVIGLGTREAAFMKVFLKKEDHDKAIKKT